MVTVGCCFFSFLCPSGRLDASGSALRRRFFIYDGPDFRRLGLATHLDMFEIKKKKKRGSGRGRHVLLPLRRLEPADRAVTTHVQAVGLGGPQKERQRRRQQSSSSHLVSCRWLSRRRGSRCRPRAVDPPPSTWNFGASRPFRFFFGFGFRAQRLLTGCSRSNGRQDQTCKSAVIDSTAARPNRLIVDC